MNEKTPSITQKSKISFLVQRAIKETSFVYHDKRGFFVEWHHWFWYNHPVKLVFEIPKIIGFCR